LEFIYQSGLKIKIKTQCLGRGIILILRQKSKGTPTQLDPIGATFWGLGVENMFSIGAQVSRFCPSDGRVLSLKHSALIFI
jgi:hypothetical protein